MARWINVTAKVAEKMAAQGYETRYVSLTKCWQVFAYDAQVAGYNPHHMAKLARQAERDAQSMAKAVEGFKAFEAAHGRQS